MDTNEKMMLLSFLVAVFIVPTSAGEWTIKVVEDLDALVGSCAVIPCSFTHPHKTLPTSRIKGTWYLSKRPDLRVYDEDDDEIMTKFRDRTKLLGQLGQNNCTLEIISIKDHDNGPYCLQIGLLQGEAPTAPTESHSFVNNCVHFKMIPDPPKPTVILPKVANEDHPFVITCSVTHTCPSPFRRPNLTWSRGEEGEISVVHRELHLGYWEVLSILTFVPNYKDDYSEVTCTANFDGGKTSSRAVTIYVKRQENYSYIIIPVVVGTVTATVFGIACFFILKKYRTRISELQNQEGSVWNRLSRLSKRNSRTDYKSTNKEKKPKPRFPSPKRSHDSRYKEDPDGDDYINTADLAIYGNL